VQTPVAVKLEQSFEGLYPVTRIAPKWSDNKDELTFEFEGTGFVLRGEASKKNAQSSHVFNTELYVDDKLVESPKLPVNFTTRRHELCWAYNLPKGKHTIRFKVVNPTPEAEIKAGEAIIYSDKAINGLTANIHY
jgi:hypothetical protein